jgi:hypothetical protein
MERVSIKDAPRFEPLTRESVAEMYGVVGDLMGDEHRVHIEEILNGGTEVDPKLELDMVFRIVQLYAIQCVKWSLTEKKITKDIGSILGEARQAAVAIENMAVKREEVKGKKHDDEEVVRGSRVTASSILEDLVGGASEEQA